jgi:hypothetical protein
LILLAKSGKPWLVALSGLPLAFSYVIRPTNSVSIFFLTLYVFFKYRRYLVGYLLSSLVVAVPFVLFSLRTYDAMFPPYYSPTRLGLGELFLEALAGNLVSPARGLFVYSPVLLFSVYGFVLKLRTKIKVLDVFLALIVLGHWVAVSSFGHWWGGHCFGPRFFTDVLPYLAYFMAPFISKLSYLQKSRTAFVAIFICLAIFSFWVHWRGANDLATWEWSGKPINVDTYPWRLWDWSDIPFLRGLGH